MFGALITPAAAIRSLVALVVLLVVGIILANVLGGLAFLGLVIWGIMLVALAVGLFLILRAGRPLVGAGAIATALSVVLAFYVMPPAWVWTGLFFLGVVLVALGSADDTARKDAWPLLLPRVFVGWALVDNAQDHFLTNWLPAVQGTGFFQSANGAANRAPMQPLDPLYQGFLKGVVVPGVDAWAGLTICGELAFGILLALGFLTPVAALGAMWQNGNYMLMKGFVAHGAYPDKVFFAVELFCLITLAGLAYGMDTSLRRFVPAWLAETVMGLPPAEAEPAPARRAATQVT